METLPGAPAVARRAAEVVLEHAHAAIAERGSFTLAVSGGRTPRAMFADLDLPWEQTTIYQVDERIAPTGDPDRNLTHLLAALPSAGLSRVLPMAVEDPDLDAATQRYATSLPDRLDLIHLGLGPDGHTASLVPGDPVLDVADRDVAVTLPYMGHRRMTLTYPVIDRARALLWVITGSDKRKALRRLLDHDASIPAGRVAADRALVLADAATAGR
jgi:6-phosphogluconolactonase